MKPSAFTLVRSAALPEALQALDDPAALPISGGQSLLVLLRLRLTAAETLVDMTRLSELGGVQRLEGRVRYGATTTHAAIEDGIDADGTCGLMPRVAAGIAYRAIRNMGTIGGSLALADPSADWPVCLLAVGATVLTQGHGGARAIPIDAFLQSAFTTDLQPGEVIAAVDVPVLPTGSRWGYAKLARKHGAFADSLAAIVWPAGGMPRVVLGATTGRATLLRRTMQALCDGGGWDDALSADVADAEPDGDSFRQRCHSATVRNALRDMDTQ